MKLKSTLWIFVTVMTLSVAQNDRFIASRQQFALELFKNTQSTSNMLISPLSIDFVLHLMFLGSTKSTTTEMKNGLEYPKSFNAKAIELNLQKWSADIKMINGVEVATKIYVNNTLAIKNSYKLSIRKTLSSDLEKIAFIKSKPATKKINKWISDSTHNLIKNMIAPGVIDKDTLMILINCIYFGGKWADPFIPNANLFENFTAIDESVKTIEFMYQSSVLNFSKDVPELKGASAVSLNYDNTTVSMLFVLPPADVDFKSWMSSINKINWSAVDKSMKPVEVRLRIPKFNITFDDDMKKFLKKMQINSIFENEAHLDKIFAGQKAKVENLFHKTIIQVDEVGTVAVGVAVMKIVSYSMPFNPPEFTANRPFIFFIRSGPTIMFVGQYVE